jgi:hypothetical protein
MRNFVLGFVSALLLVGLGYGVYQFVISPGQDNTIPRENPGDCAHLDSSASAFGKVEVTLTSKSGQSVGEVEVNLGVQPGAENYCWTQTNENGVATFEQVPADDYFVYFNDATLPPALSGGEPGPTLAIKVAGGGTAKAGIELK